MIPTDSGYRIWKAYMLKRKQFGKVRKIEDASQKWTYDSILRKRRSMSLKDIQKIHHYARKNPQIQFSFDGVLVPGQQGWVKQQWQFQKTQELSMSDFRDYNEIKRRIRFEEYRPGESTWKTPLDRNNKKIPFREKMRYDINRTVQRMVWKVPWHKNATFRFKFTQFVNKFMLRIAKDFVMRFDWLGEIGGKGAEIVGTTIDALIFAVECGVFAMFIQEEACQISAFLVKDALCQKEFGRMFLHNELSHRQQVTMAMHHYIKWHLALLYTKTGYLTYITSAMLLHNVAKHLYPQNLTPLSFNDETRRVEEYEPRDLNWEKHNVEVPLPERREPPKLGEDYPGGGGGGGGAT